MIVDNANQIRIQWDLLPDNGSSAPEGYLLLCSLSDNVSQPPQDNLSYADDDDCSDGWGQVNLSSTSAEFIWDGLQLHQQYHFAIYSLTNKGTNDVRYFNGPTVYNSKTTSHPPVVPEYLGPFDVGLGEIVTDWLIDNVTDPDSSSFEFLLDNESSQGMPILLNDMATGNFTYAAPLNYIGLDNFSYYVLDNYSVRSNLGWIQFNVQDAPAPAYNVDNFTAQVDNGTTITTRWDLYPDNDSQGPKASWYSVAKWTTSPAYLLSTIRPMGMTQTAEMAGVNKTCRNPATTSPGSACRHRTGSTTSRSSRRPTRTPTTSSTSQELDPMPTISPTMLLLPTHSPSPTSNSIQGTTVLPPATP